MSDWPASVLQAPMLGTVDPKFGQMGSVLSGMRSSSAAAAWPANNRAIYQPFEVQQTCTAYQIAFEVTTQSGNVDVGIYDENAVRLVSAGSTATAAAGLQVVNIADTTLTPGAYFLAMSCSTTAAFFRATTAPPVLLLETMGAQQQNLGAVTLLDPATFANPATAFIPLMFISTMQSTT